ncbi:unnamed protein product [Natator depressus]
MSERCRQPLPCAVDPGAQGHVESSYWASSFYGTLVILLPFRHSTSLQRAVKTGFGAVNLFSRMNPYEKVTKTSIILETFHFTLKFRLHRDNSSTLLQATIGMLTAK